MPNSIIFLVRRLMTIDPPLRLIFAVGSLNLPRLLTSLKLLSLLPQVLAYVQADAHYYWYSYDSTEEDECPKRHFFLWWWCGSRFRDELNVSAWKSGETLLWLIREVIVDKEGTSEDHRDLRLALSEILLYQDLAKILLISKVVGIIVSEVGGWRNVGYALGWLIYVQGKGQIRERCHCHDLAALHARELQEVCDIWDIDLIEVPQFMFHSEILEGLVESSKLIFL